MHTTPGFMPLPEQLSNDLVQLIPLKENDFERLYAIASDPLLWEQHPQSDRYKREVFQQFFDEAVRAGAFLVFAKDTGALIGSSRFYNYNAADDSVAIGYTFLARNCWGGHYNAALKDLMLRYAFRRVGKVLFHVGENNMRSQKAVEKLGAYKAGEMSRDDNSTALNFEFLLLRENYKGNYQGSAPI